MFRLRSSTLLVVALFVSTSVAPMLASAAQDAAPKPTQDAPKPDAKPDAPKQDAPKSEPAKPDAPKDANAQEKSDQPAKPAKPGLEHCFPADVQTFVAIDDLDALLAEWASSSWGKLFADERAAPVKVAFHGVLEAAAKESVAALGVDLVEAVTAVKGRVGAAVGGMPDAEALQPGAAPKLDEQHTIGTAVVADVGEHGAELLERVTAALQKAAERGEGVVKQGAAPTGEYVMLQKKDAPEGVVSIAAAATVGETLAVGDVQGGTAEHNRFTKLLESLAGEGADSLASVPDFRESLAAQAGGLKLMFDSGATMRTSLHMQQLAVDQYGENKDMAQFAEQMKSMVDAQKALGLADLGRLTGRFLLDGHAARVEVRQAWRGGWLPKLALAWFASDDHKLLELVPADAVAALTVRLDFVAGMNASAAAAKEIKTIPYLGIPVGGDDAPPPPSADGAPTATEAPFDARKDLLDHLDGRVVAFTSVVDESEAFPGLGSKDPMSAALVIGVKNAEALRATIDKLLRQRGMHAGRKRSEFEGFEVFSLPVGPGMSVSYALVADFLVVSPSPTLLQDVLRRKAHVELPNLKSDAVFKRQLDGVTHTPAMLLWGKLSPSLVCSFVGQFVVSRPSAGRRPPMAPIAGADDEAGGSDGEQAEPPPAPDSLDARIESLLQAVEKLDPKLVAEKLPTGAVAGLSVTPEALTIEGVSR